MASLTRDKGGLCKVQIMVPTGERDARGKPKKARRKITLGKMARDDAETIKRHVEHLASALTTGQPIRPGTADWLADVGDELHARIAAAGLCEPRAAQAQTTLGAFLEDFYAKRHDVKPTTRAKWRHTMGNLRDSLGAERDISGITAGDAEDYKLHLIAEKLAPTTIVKRLQMARQFFNAARRRGLIEKNPFSEVRATAPAPTERQHFVDRETMDLVFAVCNPTWRLILTLARYGGMRCPSEVLSLRWHGVNWEAGRVTVDSPKTEGHGKASRVIPMFPEIEPVLQEAWDAAEPGAVYVVDAPHYRAASQGPNGWQNSNLRTQFLRLLKRAGVEPWPRIFQNLRLSRETELAAEHPIHVVTAWLGNTPQIAMRHYLKVTDSDFQKAAGRGQKSGAKSGALPGQNRVQPVEAALGHSDEKSTQSKRGKQHRLMSATTGLMLLTPQMRERGLEPTQETPGKTAIEPDGGAKSGALFQPGGCTDADLAAVVAAWPTLPEDVRQSILRAVQEASADMVD